MSYKVFLSHSSKDKEIADKIRRILEDNQIKCWMAPDDIPPGASYAKTILEAIKATDYFLIVFSKNSNLSKQVSKEIDRAIHFNSTVIPFRIENITPSEENEYYLCNTQWFDAYSSSIEDHTNQLVSLIKQKKIASSKASLAIVKKKATGSKRRSLKPKKKTKTKSVIFLFVIILVVVFALKNLHKARSNKRKDLFLKSQKTSKAQPPVNQKSLFDENLPFLSRRKKIMEQFENGTLSAKELFKLNKTQMQQFFRSNQQLKSKLKRPYCVIRNKQKNKMLNRNERIYQVELLFSISHTLFNNYTTPVKIVQIPSNNDDCLIYINAQISTPQDSKRVKIVKANDGLRPLAEINLNKQIINGTSIEQKFKHIEKITKLFIQKASNERRD